MNTSPTNPSLEPWFNKLFQAQTLLIQAVASLYDKSARSIYRDAKNQELAIETVDGLMGIIRFYEAQLAEKAALEKLWDKVADHYALKPVAIERDIQANGQSIETPEGIITFIARREAKKAQKDIWQSMIEETATYCGLAAKSVPDIARRKGYDIKTLEGLVALCRDYDAKKEKKRG